MIETVRARLTLWYVTALAVVLVLVGGLIYALLARALYARIDDNLRGVMQIAMTSLANDLAEGQDTEDAARSTAKELASTQQMLAIYDATGRLLAEEGRDTDLTFSLPALETIPADAALLLTVAEAEDTDDRHRLAFRRASIPPAGTKYVVVIGSSLEPTDEELESLRIFERFYRGDARGRQQADGGAGLGLALARWIANVHGGDVTLARSSQSGTVFIVSLPAPPLS